MTGAMHGNKATKTIPWLGVAQAAAGILVVASAAMLLLGIVMSVPHRPDTLAGRMTCGLSAAVAVCMAWFGVTTARDGMKMLAPSVWRALLDLRDGLGILVVPIVRDAGGGSARFEGPPRFLAPATIYDLRYLRVGSLAAVIETIDAHDLAILLCLHDDLFALLEKLVRSRLFSAAALRCLREHCKTLTPCWREYRDARDRLTRVVWLLGNAGVLPERMMAKPG